VVARQVPSSASEGGLVSVPGAAFRGVADSVAFRASSAPYLLLDVDLRIRAANAAYQDVTHHDISEMAGESMFDVFPDNPATPEARSVERLEASFERALVSGGTDRMGLQRYDVVAGPGGFVPKSWLPVNTTVRDAEGRTVGILHHVEDVTRLVAATALEHHLLTAPGDTGLPPAVGTHGWAEAVQRDTLERRTRALLLVRDAGQALQRTSRRLETRET
jgi:hypothetical protein